MRVTVVSHDPAAKKRIEKKLRDRSFEIDPKSPQLVFIYGGDGTVIYSERLHPSIPKVAISGSPTSKTCFYKESSLEKILTRILDNRYDIKQYPKLTAEYGNHHYNALNEIQVHNRDPYIAVRFDIYIDDILRHKNIVGDGIVISTGFGSTAYYYSIGGEPFTSGLGIGFNNPHERIKSYVIKEDSVVLIHLMRGDALLIRDNDKDMIPMKPKDKISIKKSKESAQFLRFTDL